ncbi:hypothetical protein ACLOJK_041920 [Asimina triloba]
MSSNPSRGPSLSMPGIVGSKHSLDRFSLANNFTQSVKSTTPVCPDIISPALVPVNISNIITPNAYTSLFKDGNGLLVLENSGGRYPSAPAFKSCSAVPAGFMIRWRL